MGFRTLFDQRSSVAASWRGAREAGDSQNARAFWTHAVRPAGVRIA